MHASEDVGNLLHKRPGILIIGSHNVGKRTILSRLLSLDNEDDPDLSSEAFVLGWTIDTKYYTADVSVWIVHLDDHFALSALPAFSQLVALVLVFDIAEPASLSALQDWVFQTEIHKFDILLCIGNKADLVPGHSAYIEYRRCLQRHSDSTDEVTEFGFSETEAVSLLGSDEPSREMKKPCLDWCNENQIEYIEACASNSQFDNCLSADGDSQGMQRIKDALSAYLWPGMILKSGKNPVSASITENQDISDEESDYEIEYEALSAGSDESWDEANVTWVCGNEDGNGRRSKEMNEEGSVLVEKNENRCFDFEDFDGLMREIGNMHSSVRLMPDLQRRGMAGNLAMKMAAMFGEEDEEECQHN